MHNQLALNQRQRLSTAHTFQERMAAYTDYINELNQYQAENGEDVSAIITEVKQEIKCLQKTQSMINQNEPCPVEPRFAEAKREATRRLYTTRSLTLDGQGLFNEQQISSSLFPLGVELP
jgi:hypothetical protein